jgi:hypothetical protein
MKVIIVDNTERGLTTHSTGARVSLAFIVNLGCFDVVCAPG